MGIDENLSRRERKKQVTRQRLLEAAFRLFQEQGYDATTVEQMAEAADVAKGTFFNYFETKDAILPALVEWRLQQLEEELLPEQGAPASPVGRIKLALRLVAEDPLADQMLMRRLFAAGVRYRHIRPATSLTRLLSEQIRQAQAAGEIRAGLDPLYLGSLIRSVFFQQVMMWHCGYRPVPLPDMLESAVDLLLEGIGSPEWRQSS